MTTDFTIIRQLFHVDQNNGFSESKILLNYASFNKQQFDKIEKLLGNLGE